jgi:nitroimidazol reductase NimA-like FMN-containing flavoprotein (pyridoxamine 5'-phosphate oxidase superfamily)
MTNPTSEAGSRTRGATIELSRDECLRLLASHRFGRLAVAGATDAPVIRPVNYVFDDASQAVVFRTAHGSKFSALLRAAKAAFEIDGIDEETRTGWSVIITGVAEEVTRPSEVQRLLSLGLEPWVSGPHPHWMHVRAWTVAGRRIVLPADRAGGPDLG